jgi:hypothetical protein
VTGDLVERLHARLDEIEKIAKRASRRRWDHPSDAPWESARLLAARVGTTVTRFQALQSTPDEMLRTIQAHREILDRHAPLWRTIGFDVDRDTEYAEVEVCGHCVRKHAHYGTRAAVPEYPCADVRSVAAIYLPDIETGDTE